LLCFASSVPLPPPSVFYSLSLHDALPIYDRRDQFGHSVPAVRMGGATFARRDRSDLQRDDRAVRRVGGLPVLRAEDRYAPFARRSEEHTSELQSRENLVCRLLLEKKKTTR